ncbi:MAG: hypothetical protein CL959_06590 [Euryarchaeota archaeon]|nr:hypothetical protein [Euryarchaeota archaeon]
MDQINDEFSHEIYFDPGERLALNSAQQIEMGYIQLIREDPSSILEDLTNEANRLTSSVRLLEE